MEMDVVVDEVRSEESEEFAGAVAAAVGGAIEFQYTLAGRDWPSSLVAMRSVSVMEASGCFACERGDAAAQVVANTEAGAVAKPIQQR